MTMSPRETPIEAEGSTPVPLWLWFLGILGVLALLAWDLGTLLRVGNANYFHYLAHSLNHGSLSLIDPPASLHDLTVVDGRLFLYWGPMPAVVLMPFVAIFGISWPDAWVTLLLGALLSTITLALLRRTTYLHGLTGLPLYLLVFVLTFGSPVLALAVAGEVWATSQLFAATFLSAGVFVAFGNLTNRTTAGASLLIGLSCLCRPSLAGAAVWLLYRIGEHGRGGAGKGAFRRIAVACAILGACVGLQLAYNYGRFGNLLETGYTSQNVAGAFRPDGTLHGPLSLHNFSRNFYYHYLAYPYPYSEETWWGGSLFLMTPLYFGAFFSLFRKHSSRSPVWPLWVTCTLIALPSLLVNGTGWVQIGPRYTVDYAPFLILLVARGIASWPTSVIFLLGLVSCGHYLYGVFSNCVK